MKLVCSSQLVFQNSADSQIFVINDAAQKSLISFSGFLNSTSDNLENFRCLEIIIYTGANVKNIIETTLKRSADNQVNEHHSFRQFDITPKLKGLIVDWIFTAEMLDNLD